MTTCPDCEGSKERVLYICGVKSPPQPCYFCAGTGTVEEEKAERWHAGRAMAEDRKARKLSLREEARRLGISAKELSDREWGRA